MSLSIYTKNISANLLKAQTGILGQVRDPNAAELTQVQMTMAQMTSFIAHGCLSPNLESRYKFNLSLVVTRYLAMIAQVSFQGSDIYDNLLKEILALVEKALG